MQNKNHMTILNKDTKELETYDILTGELVATSSSVAPLSKFVFDIGIAHRIIELVQEGYTMKKVSTLDGMPNYSTLLAWKRAHRDFGMALEAAIKDRATVFHDKAVAILEDDDYTDKESLNNAKFKFDGYMKLAERGDPNRYQAKPTTVVAGGGAGAPTIIVNTGITRHKEEYIDAETATESTESGREVRAIHEAGTEITINTDRFAQGFGEDPVAYAGGDGETGGVFEGFEDSSVSTQEEGDKEEGFDEEGEPQW